MFCSIGGMKKNTHFETIKFVQLRRVNSELCILFFSLVQDPNSQVF